MVKEMSASNTITKTVWQYSKTLPEDTMEFLKGIALDYSKVKNYTYNRYSGIKSLGRLTPVFDIMSEVRHSGIRTRLGLPSAYFDPAIIEAVADIKGMWGMLKNKIGTLITANENLSDEDRVYLRTVLKLDKIYAAVLCRENYEMPKKAEGLDLDVERLNNLLRRLTRKHLAKPETGSMDCFSIAPAAMIYEPRNSINILNNKGEIELRNGVRCFDYQKIWTTILESEPVFGYKTYFCGVSGYDDTPRRGRSGEVMIHNSPETFQMNLKKLVEKSIRYGNEYLFINAWNEWGEGMYLEPDKQEGYRYLEAVKNAVNNASMTSRMCNTAADYSETVKKEISQLSYNAKKFKCLFEIIDKWLFLEQDGYIDFSGFLNSEGVNRVAIYGMASLGRHLLLQLQKEKFAVAFGIDRYVGQHGDDFMIYRLEDKFPQTDAIIITSYDTVAITEALRGKYDGKIYTLEEMIDSMIKRNIQNE
jgi:hypothetical protein